MEEESRKSFAQITLYNQLIKEMDDLYRVYAKNCNLSETAFWILYCIREREKEAFTQRDESSEALGLTNAQTYLYVIIPQTIRRLIPLSINLITRMIKTTSLILMIGVVEVLKVAQQIIEANRMTSPNGAFGVYLTVFLLYFIACWPISMLAKYLEKKWS